QPTHPYDAARLPGGGLSVRRAGPGEQLTTLDGEVRTLGDGDDCVIGDAEGTAVGIGGIMGGGSSEIHDGTTSVVLEAAWFEPMVIARTSKRLGLRSEASARFEKGVDSGSVERAAARYCELAIALCGASVADRTVWRDEQHAPTPATLTLRTARVNRLLGTRLSHEAIDRHLTSIGFAVERTDPALATVTAPSWRPDVTIEEALIEEVARHHGYGNVEHAVPTTPRVGRLTPRQREQRFVRDILCGLGIHEAMGSPLLGPGDHDRAGLPEKHRVVADRPLVVEESVLRGSLLPGLLRSIALNVGQRASEVRLFEIGRVWDRPEGDSDVVLGEPDRRAIGPAAGLPVETERLAVALWPAAATDATSVWEVISDALRLASPGVRRIDDAHEPGLHPTRLASARVGNMSIGVLGEVDPAVLDAWGIEGRVAWLDLALDGLHGADRRSETTVEVSRFPSSDIDLAFVVDDHVAAADVGATLRAAAGPLVTGLALFDVYRGPGVAQGHRSLAYRLRFCALDRTLKDAEVGEWRTAAIRAVESAHGATLRG
ncbi:MAG TPA: phenylalanine--tRNA ligase subunit beta, partial [Acidimicrobiales bacterium]|nr:phenylalanine--tRNA ligase subunit beta [Acidimicrobiales bacterium]